MAQASGTFDTYSAVGNREDLEDRIYQITPEETPLISLIGSTKVSAVRHDWQTDTLATPSTSNAQVEGDEYTYDEPDPTTRLSNYTQILRKSVVVSQTQDAVDKAGRAKELAYQMSKRSVELKKDIEATFLSNQASVAGNSTTARKLGGLPAWLTTNAERGTGGADGGFSANTGLVVAATDGTQRAFTKTLLDDALQSVYDAGGAPKIVMVNPYNKRVFSTFMSDANVAAFRMPASERNQGTIMAAADAYMSDWGLIDILPNRVMSASSDLGRNIFVLQPDMLARGVLRPINQDIPAKTGDANKRVWITELTLVVKNEAALGVIADVNTAAA